MRLTMTDWEAFTPFEILGRLQGLKWQQEQALAALAGKLAGTPPLSELCPTCGRPLSKVTLGPSPDASQHTVDIQIPTD